MNQGFFNESWGSREKQCGVAKGRRWGKELLHALQDGGEGGGGLVDVDDGEFEEGERVWR